MTLSDRDLVGALRMAKALETLLRGAVTVEDAHERDCAIDAARHVGSVSRSLERWISKRAMRTEGLHT